MFKEEHARTAVLVAVILAAGCVLQPETPADVRLVGGLLWTGKTFQAGELAIRDGRFVASPVATTTIDLAGRFVIPGLCDAHSHDVQSSWQLDETLAALADTGITALKVLSSVPEYTAEIAPQLATTKGLDVVFAGPPVTGPGGHPIALQHRLHGYGAYPGKAIAELDGFAHIVLTDTTAIPAVLDALVARRIDFLKIMLLDSEYHADRVGDTSYFGRTGLDPALVAPLVAAAHDRSLRVSAHVNSAADFRLAVTAGVDEIAHLPGRTSPVVLSSADAQLAAARGTVVVTTAALAGRLAERDPARFAAVRNAQAESLAILKAHGVRLALGTDSHEGLVAEAVYLAELGALTAADVIAMATTDCAATVFPDRKLGRLAPGYEATYVVLERNPLRDLAALGAVHSRVRAPHGYSQKE